SRYAAGAHDVGDPIGDPRGYAERLVRTAEEIRADAILPVTEVTLGSVYAFGVADRGGGGCPERAAYEAAVDKHALLERAARVGLTGPRTVLFEDPALLSALPDSFRYPVVLKSRRSRFLRGNRWVAGEARVVHGAGELSAARGAPGVAGGGRVVHGGGELSAARSAPGFAGGVLLQEFVPGGGEGVFLLAEHGRAV